MFQGDDKGEEKGKKKVSVRTVDLPIEANIYGLSLRDLDAAMEKEVKQSDSVYGSRLECYVMRITFAVSSIAAIRKKKLLEV